MEVRFLAGAIRRSAVLVLLLAILGGVAGVGLSRLRGVQYASTASLTITEPDLSAITGSQAQEQPDRYVATQVGILESTGIAAAVAQKVGGMTPLQVQHRSTVAQRGTSDIVDVTARAATPGLAAELANLLATTYLDQQRGEEQTLLQGAIGSLQADAASVQRQLSALTPAQQAGAAAAALQARYSQLSSEIAQVRLTESLASSAGQVFDRGVAPRAPLPRKAVQKGAIGAAAGGLLGVVLAVLVAVTRPKLRTERDVEDAFGVAVAAHIPWAPNVSMPTAAFDREVLKVCLLIEAVTAARRPKTVLVTSPVSGGGVSTIGQAITRLLVSGGHRAELVEVLDPVRDRSAGVPVGAPVAVPGVRLVPGAVSVPTPVGAAEPPAPRFDLGGHGNGDSPDVVVYDGGSIEVLAPSVGLAHVVDVIVLLVALPDTSGERSRRVLRAGLAGAEARLVLVTHETHPRSTKRRHAGR